ncbi:TetR family transcriptional regulator [Nocardia sp. NPDC004068]|uniref:TetR family transcriptional regulator n=1 Tax=Nocardia sp. NPDC004068 TaxID=3364303 RepID=UPI003681907C
MDDSRARILRTALELFAERGAHAVSVREIAEGVGLTKTAVLYHFPSKSHILAALVEPLLTESEAVVEAARAIEDPAARGWAVLEALVDVWLSHARLLRVHLRDQSLSEDAETFARMRDLAVSVQELLAGPAPELVDRVRAAQVYAALSDPIVFFADQPRDALRAAVLDGARRLLGTTAPVSGGIPAPPRIFSAATDSARRGRPGVVTDEMVRAARRRRASGESIADIAAGLGVSRATLYRRLAAESR